MEGSGAPDASWELQLREAAEHGLSSIQLPGDWLAAFHSALEEATAEISDEQRVRSAGAKVLKAAIEMLTESKREQSFMRKRAQEQDAWPAMTPKDFEEVWSEVSALLLTTVAAYEAATGPKYGPGPKQAHFPFHSSFRGWIYGYVVKAAHKVRRSRMTAEHVVDFSTEEPDDRYDRHMASAVNHEPPVELPVLQVDYRCLSPDVLAISKHRDRIEFETLQAVQQAYLSWRRRDSGDFDKPRTAVRAAISATMPHLNYDLVSKQMDRSVANVAYGVARLLDRHEATPRERTSDDELELESPLEVGRLVWRALELEGLLPMLVQALLRPREIGSQRIDARAVWACEALDWLDRLGPMSRESLRPQVEDHCRVIESSALDVAVARRAEPIGAAIVRTHQRLETWLSTTREGL